jgi:hypothetical protein
MSNPVTVTIATGPDEIERLRKLARAVLLFHGAPSWTEKEKREWCELTGSQDATTRILCDLARAALTMKPSASS